MERGEGGLPGWKLWTHAPLDQSEKEGTMSVSIRIGDTTCVSDNATVRRIMSTRAGNHLARKNGRSKNKGRRRVGGRLVGRGRWAR